MLHEQNNLSKVYCMSYDYNIDIPHSFIRSLKNNLSYNFLNLVLSIVEKSGLSFNLRNTREKLFERFVLSNLWKDKFDKLYMSKPLFPKLISKAKSKKITTATKASVAHPIYNYMIVRNEQFKLGINSKSPYTSIKRADKVYEAITKVDKLLINSRNQKESFLINSYSTYAHKIIPYEGMFCKSKFSYEYDESLYTGNTVFIHISHGNLIKGIHYLLTAWQVYKRKYQNSKTELHIIGSMDQNLRTALKNNHSFNNLGQLFFHNSSSAPFSLVKHPTAFINSSLSEAGPATIMESLSRGIPVITSKNCGLSDLIVDGENGFKYDYDDTKKLVEHIRWFEENKDQLKRIKKNAYNSVQKYTADFCKEEMKMIFSKLI